MRFKFDEETEAFREEVRTFLRNDTAEHGNPAEGDDAPSRTTERARHDWTVAFQKRLAARNWLTMAWPKEYGGGGASHMHQLVYNEEMAYAGRAAGNMGISWVGPTLMIYGTEEQKKRFIPGITEARDWWCTLYSEPGAGSDLASLQTRAVRDGDSYLINGQKIWTSGGQFADWGWLAARTDPAAPKHRGISLFLLDMKSPGVTVKPLINIADVHHFNEVFIEDVRIPANQLVGEENRGWYYIATALDFERSGIERYIAIRKTLDSFTEALRRHPELRERRPTIAADVAARATELEVGTMMAYRVATMQARGLVPNHEASAAKIFASELEQRVALTGMQMLGMTAQVHDPNQYGVGDRSWHYLDKVRTSISQGTNEIQRNIIATRGLGLPRQ